VLGKPIGITLSAWLAVKLGLASRPTGVSWRMVHGAAWLGGIGFTMSLFIAGLAYGNVSMLTAAKLGTFLASVLAGVIGWLVLRSASSKAGCSPESGLSAP
jgi:NhaA family Na+:H+ antiporter